MRQLSRFPFALTSAALGAAGLLAACGGGGSAVTPISGSVVKGPVNGAQVCAFKAVAAGKGDQIKCVTTNSAGAYTMEVDYVGDVVIEASGGTYTDEATGTTKTLSDPLQLVLNAQGTAATGIVTPLTSVAYSLSKAGTGGVSSASFGTAATTVASQFQLGTANIATTMPAVTGTANAYGQILKAVSQYMANGNTLASFTSFSAPATIQTAFNTAYATANGSSVSFTLGSTSTGTGTGSGAGTGTGTGGSGSTGTGTGGGTTTGNKTLVVTVVAQGINSTVTVPNVPAPTTQTEFCSGIEKDSTFTQLSAQGGGSFTVNSCSFSGNSGKVDATLRIVNTALPGGGFTLPYQITYTYN